MACAARSAQRLVCLNNESRRPKGDERFCLPHSRFEGKFVPIHQQMTFRAEMEALDGLDEAERNMEAGANKKDKIDKQGDVTFGLRMEMSAGFSKRSVEARLRWKCPEYREKVIRKREYGPGAYLPVAAAPRVQDDDAAAPPSALPRLHDLLQSDMVSWRPESGGWVGTDTLKLAGKKRRGAATKTEQARRRNSQKSAPVVVYKRYTRVLTAENFEKAGWRRGRTGRGRRKERRDRRHEPGHAEQGAGSEVAALGSKRVDGAALEHRKRPANSR